MRQTYNQVTRKYWKYKKIKRVKPIYIDEYQLWFEVAQWISLDILIKTQWVSAYTCFDKLFAILQILTWSKAYITGCFDYITSNVFRDQENDIITFIDYERTTNKKISLPYLYYRAINDFYMRTGWNKEVMGQIYKHYNINLLQRMYYSLKELKFQKTVSV